MGDLWKPFVGTTTLATRKMLMWAASRASGQRSGLLVDLWTVFDTRRLCQGFVFERKLSCR